MVLLASDFGLRLGIENEVGFKQSLAETMGVSAEKVRELVSDGKIGMTELQDAIEKGIC